MGKELEDIIVLDLKTKRLYNFSDIVPENLKESEITEGFEKFVGPDQQILAIEYFTEEQVRALLHDRRQ